MISTPNEYIKHHLVHSKYNIVSGLFNDDSVHSFWTINVDTVFFSLITGIFFLSIFIRCANTISLKKPSKTQNLIELLVETINQQVKDCLGIEDPSVGALGLTIFVWVFLMNFIDLIPVDLFPLLANYIFGIKYLRCVPTADINMTTGMSLSIFFIVYIYSIKFNGFLPWIKNAFSKPFGIWLFPINFVKHLITDISRPISLSLRLFGNIYAGEIIFILIALTPAYLQWFLAGSWLGFHLFVITIQAFIFMMLTIIYIGLERQQH